jgi:hypothetical protein
LDAGMVKAQTGIDYWQVLKKMCQGQGEKSLEGYRKRISKEWTEFRFATLYTDYDFGNKKWKDANQIDQVFSFRSKMTAEQLLKYLEYQILKLN